MKLKLTVAVVAAMLSQGAMAQQQQQQQQPMQQQQGCPTVSQIAAVGVSMVMVDDQQQQQKRFTQQQQQQQMQWFGIIPNNTFGTNYEWSFFAGDVTASGQTDAMTAINSKLSSLTFATAIADQQNDVTICFYGKMPQGQQGQQDQQGGQVDFGAIAVRPPISIDQPSLMQYMQKMKKK